MAGHPGKRGPYQIGRIGKFDLVDPLTAHIPLTRGCVAIVDASLAKYLSSWNWALSGGYACRGTRTNGRLVNFQMHRTVMECAIGMLPKDVEVDHKNRNRLDNRRGNLRIATRMQNQRNIRPFGTGSRFKGVCRMRNKWSARIHQNRICEQIGTFATEEEAALAYDKRASELFGEFAYLNFPEVAHTGSQASVYVKAEQ